MFHFLQKYLFTNVGVRQLLSKKLCDSHEEIVQMRFGVSGTFGGSLKQTPATSKFWNSPKLLEVGGKCFPRISHCPKKNIWVSFVMPYLQSPPFCWRRILDIGLYLFFVHCNKRELFGRTWVTALVLTKLIPMHNPPHIGQLPMGLS